MKAIPVDKIDQYSTDETSASTRHTLQEGPIPLYYQLEQKLRARIRSGEFAPGDALPTEDQICGDYGVSRITVRRALDALRQQGLIDRRRGVGSFVAEKRDGMDNRLTASLSEFLAAAGTLETKALALGKAIPPKDIAELLAIEHGTEGIRLCAVGSLDKRPVAYLEIWFPVDIGNHITLASLDHNIPVVRLVEQLANLRITRAKQTIVPDIAGDHAAQHLDIAPEKPVLHVRRLYFAGDRPIELANVRYHPDRYRYAIDFED